MKKITILLVITFTFLFSTTSWGGDRHGPPPCFFTISEKSKWKDKKKEDFMYNVSISVNNFDLRPVWKT